LQPQAPYPEWLDGLVCLFDLGTTISKYKFVLLFVADLVCNPGQLAYTVVCIHFLFV